MRVGFLGLAAVPEMQRRAGTRFDRLVQVGGLGVPAPDASDPHLYGRRRRRDFGRFLGATGRRAASIR